MDSSLIVTLLTYYYTNMPVKMLFLGNFDRCPIGQYPTHQNTMRQELRCYLSQQSQHGQSHDRFVYINKLITNHFMVVDMVYKLCASDCQDVDHMTISDDHVAA